MDKQFERIKEILGKDCERSSQNAIRYLTYLKNSENTLPSNWYRGLPMGRTICDWRMGDDDIIAKVKRISDQKIFEIGLSLLECADFKNELLICQ